MKDYYTRLGLIVLLTLFGAYAVSDPSSFRLGPDLSGGTILIYQTARDETGANATPDMNRLLPVLKERLDPAGLYNYVIRALGPDRVEIIMPRQYTELVEQVKRQISTAGQLEFRMVADARMKGYVDLVDAAESLWPRVKDISIGEIHGKFVRYGVWEPIPTPTADALPQAEQKLQEAEAAAKQNPADVIATDRLADARNTVQRLQAETSLLTMAEKLWAEGKRAVEGELVRFVPLSQAPPIKPEEMERRFIKNDADGRPFVLARWNDDGLQFDPSRTLAKIDDDGNRYVLMLVDKYNVIGKYLIKVEATVQEGSPAVSFTFDSEGGRRFGELTGEFKPEADGTKHQLGVILDNRLRSAPNLIDRIYDRGVITGRFSKEEVDELVKILEGGQLPFALDKDPVSQFQIAPTLGADTIRAGTYSIVLSLVLVFGAMLAYYRFAGMVAVIGLLLNLLFTVAVLVFFQVVWTLPGLAGLVLTIGMAVDSNVLIYERIREEMENGLGLGTAIRVGYEKALSTIIDSNLTTILTAIILFVIGTDQIKGYAVTLIAGLITSLFCAIYVTRAIFDWGYDNRLVRKLSMGKLLTKTNIDFLSYRHACYVGSAILIAVGLVATVYRGQNNMDIDFTGGTMVGVKLTQPLSVGELRKKVSTLADVAVEEVQAPGQTAGLNYVIRTTERTAVDEKTGQPIGEAVQAKVALALKGYLAVPELAIGQVTPIPAATPENAATLTSDLKRFAGGEQALLDSTTPLKVVVVREAMAEVLGQMFPNEADPNNLFAITGIGTSENNDYKQFRATMKVGLADTLAKVEHTLEGKPAFEQYNQFGAQVAVETQNRALVAIVLSWLSIIIYVWFRFGSWTFGVGGVVALIHDCLTTIGTVALVSLAAQQFPFLSMFYLTDMKIDLNGVAAVLTLIGYSINDTIVIFDRIREKRGKATRVSEELVNRSINETLSRTIITSALTFMVVLVLFLGAGPTLRGFSFILAFGIITGSYSTIFIACPVMLSLQDWGEKRAKGRAELAKVSPKA